MTQAPVVELVVTGPVLEDAVVDELVGCFKRGRRLEHGILVMRFVGDVGDPGPSKDPEERVARATDVLAPAIEAMATTPMLVAATASGRLVGMSAVLAIGADLVHLCPNVELVPFSVDHPPVPGAGWMLRRVLPSSTVTALAATGIGLTGEQAAAAAGSVTVAAESEAVLERRLASMERRGWQRCFAHVAAARAGTHRTAGLRAALTHDVQLAALWE